MWDMIRRSCLTDKDVIDKQNLTKHSNDNNSNNNPEEKKKKNR